MDKNIERFLENNNMNYLFLLLGNLEMDRLQNLPDFVKKKFNEKLTEMALAHVAKNDIPDYIVESDSDEFKDEE